MKKLRIVFSPWPSVLRISLNFFTLGFVMGWFDMPIDFRLNIAFAVFHEVMILLMTNKINYTGEK